MNANELHYALLREGWYLGSPTLSGGWQGLEDFYVLVPFNPSSVHAKHRAEVVCGSVHFILRHCGGDDDDDE